MENFQGIEISEDNFVSIHRSSGEGEWIEYEVIVWPSESDYEGDLSKAISRTIVHEISDELSGRADVDDGSF